MMATGTMVTTAGKVPSTAVVAAVVVQVVVTAAGTLAAAIVVVATADDISSALSSFIAQMTEHFLQILDFMLQPFKKKPLSECLIHRIKIKYCQITNSSIEINSRVL